MINYRKITRLMVNATKDILHKSCQSWLDMKYPNTKLTIKIGTGKATHHKKLSHGNHQIVFGVDMIKEVMESEYISSKWRHGEEIVERQYFNGVLSPQHMMVAAVMHEYAHFVQVLNGGRTYKSVHNKNFYEILDRMHANGHANNILIYLMSFKEFKEMCYKHEHKKDMSITFTQQNIAVGKRLTFVNKEKKEISGIVERTSKRTVTINVHQGKYRVPYHLILDVV